MHVLCFFRDGAGTFSNGRLHCDLQVIQKPTLATCPLGDEGTTTTIPYSMTPWMIFLWTWMDLGIEEAHLRGVNDLCRFLHELLHALDVHFSPREDKEGTKDNMKCQNFKSCLPVHIIACCCISSSVVSCYFIIFHLLSDAIWCRCARPCARRFMWAHALCQGGIVLSVFMSQTNFNHDKFWKNSSFSTHFLFTRFVGRLNVAVLLRGADGLPVRAVGAQGALSRWGPSQCPPKKKHWDVFLQSFVVHLRTNFEDNLTPADDYFQQISFCHIWYTCHNLYIYIPYARKSRIQIYFTTH